MSEQKIVTLFDHMGSAKNAQADLKKAGFEEKDIIILGKQEIDEKDKALHDRSIWDKLFGNDVVEEKSEVYARAIENDGVILTIRVENDTKDKAMQILEHHYKIERSQSKGTGEDLSMPPAIHGSSTQS